MALLSHVTSRHIVTIEFPSDLTDILNYHLAKFVMNYMHLPDYFNHIPLRNIRHLHFTNLSQQWIYDSESFQTEIQTLNFIRPSFLIPAQNEYKFTKSLCSFYIFLNSFQTILILFGEPTKILWAMKNYSTFCTENPC